MKNIILILCLLSLPFASYSQGTSLSVHLEWENASCVNDFVTKVSAWGRGGTPPYSYLWNNGQTTSTLTDLPAGIHSVVVTDAALNTATASADLYTTGICSKASGHDFLQFPDRSNVIPSTVYNVNFLPSQEVGFYDDRTTLTNNELSIMEGVPLIVHSGVSLTLDHCTLRAWAGMWKGIIVESGATLTLTNTIIKDAEYGIYAMDGSNVYVYNSQFTNNVVGIETEQNDPGTFNDITIIVTGTTFDASGSMHAGYPQQPLFGTAPKAGIIFHNMLSTVGSNASPENVFRNLNCGIIADASTVLITNTKFANIRNSSFYSDSYMGSGIACIGGIGIFSATVSPYINQTSADPTFSNCDYGIYADKTALNATNCKMDLMGTGIYATKCPAQSDVVIENNTITATYAGIKFFNNEGAHLVSARLNTIRTTGSTGVCIGAYEAGTGYNHLTVQSNNLTCAGSLFGIDLSGCAASYVDKNVINENSPGALGFSGIRVNGCSAPVITCNTVSGINSELNHASYGVRSSLTANSTIKCNAVTRTTNGLSFLGLCASTNGISGNTMNQHWVGLSVNNSGITGQQVHTGNRWVGPFASRYGADNLNSSLPGLFASRFTVHTGPGTLYYPALPSYDATWFVSDDRGTPYICPSDQCSGGSHRLMGPGVLDPLDGAIANDSYVSEDFKAETKWMAKQYLFEKLYLSPDLVKSNPILNHFYKANAESSIGKLQKVKLHMDGENYYDEILAAAVQAVDSLLKDLQMTSGDFSSVNWKTKKSSLHRQAGDLEANFTKLNEKELEATYMRLANAKADNELVSPTQVPETNEMLINQVYLETLAEGKSILTTSQASIIQDISRQCPYSGGPAVYRARVLYQLIDPTAHFDDDSLCIALRESQNLPANIDDTGILLVPNPANEAVTVFYKTHVQGECNLLVFDVTGKKVKQVSLPCENQKFEFSVSELGSGMYIVDVVNGGASIGRTRLVIQK